MSIESNKGAVHTSIENCLYAHMYTCTHVHHDGGVVKALRAQCDIKHSYKDICMVHAKFILPSIHFRVEYTEEDPKPQVRLCLSC